jgi:hypothetical protein
MIDTSRVHLLPDPIPREATIPGQWWPPRLLDPAYLLRHVDSFDVLHVHFGFEGASVETLREVVSVLDRNQIPLVLTVHDLHNPHFADPTLHLAQLDVLVPAAAVIVTLTHGAASVIRRRWGHESVVLPHPHVLPIGAVGAARPTRPDPVVAIHGKGLRANIHPWPILDALLDGDLPSCRIRFDLDREGLQATESDARLKRYERAGVDVRVHPRFTDAELVEYLTDVDVLVLPYRFGTHSGWVEACHDAGTTVVTPDCGFFTEQHSTLEYGYDLRGLDAAGLLRAVSAGLAARGGQCTEDLVLRHQRTAERARVQDAMVELYDRALVTSSAA